MLWEEGAGVSVPEAQLWLCLRVCVSPDILSRNHHACCNLFSLGLEGGLQPLSEWEGFLSAGRVLSATRESGLTSLPWFLPHMRTVALAPTSALWKVGHHARAQS